MKNKLSLFATIIFLSFCFVIFYKGLNNSNTYKPKINDEKSIPIFEARDFNSSVYLKSENIFEEDIFYVVNIWASWCVPCRTEHPLLMELSKNQSIELIGLNYRDNLDNAKNFINELMSAKPNGNAPVATLGIAAKEPLPGEISTSKPKDLK